MRTDLTNPNQCAVAFLSRQLALVVIYHLAVSFRLEPSYASYTCIKHEIIYQLIIIISIFLMNYYY